MLAGAQVGAAIGLGAEGSKLALEAICHGGVGIPHKCLCSMNIRGRRWVTLDGDFYHRSVSPQ